MKCTSCSRTWERSTGFLYCPFCGIPLTGESESEPVFCPVCKNPMTRGEVCSECGYDESLDAETYPTLSPAFPPSVRSRSARKRLWSARSLSSAEAILARGKLLRQIGDADAAFVCFLHAAELGNPEAQYEAGGCFFRGEGTAQDRSAAQEWYRKSAAQGNADAKAALRTYAK